MKIIAKKAKAFFGNKNGFIRPIFEIDNNNHFIPIQQNEYPNNGQIETN